jgi:hypothetical protein
MKIAPVGGERRAWLAPSRVLAFSVIGEYVHEMAARALVLLVAITLVLTSCGSGHGSTTVPRKSLDRNKLEAQVKALANALLRQQQKLTHARPGTHIRDVTCVKREGDRRTFQCHLSYSSGENKTVVIRLTPDGSHWRVVPKPQHHVPRQQRV